MRVDRLVDQQRSDGLLLPGSSISMTSHLKVLLVEVLLSLR